MYCTNCGAEIDENDASCPYCGYLNPYGAERKYMKDLSVQEIAGYFGYSEAYFCKKRNT